MSLNPNYLGFIFYEKSPRFVGNISVTLGENGLSAERPSSLNWINQLSPVIPRVGVFVNSSNYTVEKTAELLGLDVVQLHGDEKPSDCALLRQKGLEVWKAFSIHAAFDFEILKAYEEACDTFLFDAKGDDRGGNGVSFDWNLIEQYKSGKPFLLSGGIGPEHISFFQNIQNLEWLRSKGMYGLDINSRFEIEPGMKNVDLIKKFKNELPG